MLDPSIFQTHKHIINRIQKSNLDIFKEFLFQNVNFEEKLTFPKILEILQNNLDHFTHKFAMLRSQNFGNEFDKFFKIQLSKLSEKKIVHLMKFQLEL